jgi:hypothetical protein
MLFTIKKVTTPHINLSQTTIDNPVHRLLIIIFIQSPIFGKIIAYAIGNNPQSNILLVFG